MNMNNPSLNEEQIREFRGTGHLTVPKVFDATTIEAALADLAEWSIEFINSLTTERRAWYLEQDDEASQLRKLDHPAFYRPAFADLARHANLASLVRQLIGGDVHVFFSQVFMKPPEVGGPKPVHQDNFYFGPDDLNATLTAWVALDEATVENGCLFYGDQHVDKVLEHSAPVNEPYNLQVNKDVSQAYSMSPAPVPRGGVSFHHGNSLHQSSANRSQKPRRAVAFHYLRNDARLVNPALAYNSEMSISIT